MMGLQEETPRRYTLANAANETEPIPMSHATGEVQEIVFVVRVSDDFLNLQSFVFEIVRAPSDETISRRTQSGAGGLMGWVPLS